MALRWLTLPLFSIALACSSAQPKTELSVNLSTSTVPSSSASPAPPAAPVEPSGSAAPTSAVATVVEAPNPFDGAELLLNPSYTLKVAAAAKADKANSRSILKLASNPTATWLDSIASVSQIRTVLEAANQQQVASGKPVLALFVVYDLPNRDCSAKASAGELSVDKGGEEKYQTQFIDKIAAEFAAYPRVRIAAIIEPDSLPNLATNLSIPKCAASERAYRNSIAYAISKLSMPHVSLYLDAAHAGWLGWEGNRQKIAKIFKEVLNQGGGVDKIRGFATNVSNYNTVSGGDGKSLGPANPCPDEGTYVAKLNESLVAEGITGKKFIIDTARNGRIVRGSWGNWCNIRGAGVGPRPQASPMPLVDAYFWVKPPGESDGTSRRGAARFDEGCVSRDSMPNAPEAGHWFQAHAVELVKNANPPL